jgi:hypothetical protein
MFHFEVLWLLNYCDNYNWSLLLDLPWILNRRMIQHCEEDIGRYFQLHSALSSPSNHVFCISLTSHFSFLEFKFFIFSFFQFQLIASMWTQYFSELILCQTILPIITAVLYFLLFSFYYEFAMSTAIKSLSRSNMGNEECRITTTFLLILHTKTVWRLIDLMN